MFRCKNCLLVTIYWIQNRRRLRKANCRSSGRPALYCIPTSQQKVRLSKVVLHYNALNRLQQIFCCIILHSHKQTKSPKPTNQPMVLHLTVLNQLQQYWSSCSILHSHKQTKSPTLTNQSQVHKYICVRNQDEYKGCTEVSKNMLLLHPTRKGPTMGVSDMIFVKSFTILHFILGLNIPKN